MSSEQGKRLVDLNQVGWWLMSNGVHAVTGVVHRTGCEA